MPSWQQQGSVRRRKSVLLDGWVTTTGSLTGPGAFLPICQTPALFPETYTVQWTVTLAGTPNANDANNFRIVQTNPIVFIAESVNAAAAGSYPQAPVTWTIPPGAGLGIFTGPNNSTSGAVYTGTLPAQGGTGMVTFGVDWSANHKWVISSLIVATNQLPTVAPYPTATVYLGGQQIGVQEGATWTGNQDIFTGVVEMTADDLNVAFTGGVAGSVATAIIEGDSYLWTADASGA